MSIRVLIEAGSSEPAFSGRHYYIIPGIDITRVQMNKNIDDEAETLSWDDTIISSIPDDTRIVFDTRYSILDTCAVSVELIS